jgi:predicted Zn-dependent protease with MMP-like domain
MNKFMQKLNPVRSNPPRVNASLQAGRTSNGVNRKEFEKIVKEGIKAIPERFLRKLENVAIVIEDEPTPAQKKKLNIHPDWTLFGLYEGVPQTERGRSYNAVLPDKITIFQKPIEGAARNEKNIKEMVKNTVWHEIAHHFGMDEARVRQAEARRREILRRGSIEE